MMAPLHVAVQGRYNDVKVSLLVAPQAEQRSMGGPHVQLCLLLPKGNLGCQGQQRVMILKLAFLLTKTISIVIVKR